MLMPMVEPSGAAFATASVPSLPQAPGLFFAGHYRDGISLGDSLASGHDVAERIEKFLAGSATRGPNPATGPLAAATP